jgi:hypothetical protein
VLLLPSHRRDWRARSFLPGSACRHAARTISSSHRDVRRIVSSGSIPWRVRLPSGLSHAGESSPDIAGCAPSCHQDGGHSRYLIPFAPLAFAPQRQKRSSAPLSPPVFLPISTHFTAPPEVPHAPTSLEIRSLRGTSPVELGAFTPDLKTRLRAL